MTCAVKVTTIRDGHPDKECVIDHDVYDSRVWLGKHCWWAFRNGVMIITEPTDKPVDYRPSSGTPDRPTRPVLRAGSKAGW